MTCHDIRPQLSEYVDGAFEPSVRAAIARHLAECPSCEGLAMDLARIRTAAKGLGPIDPPGHIWLEIAGQVHLDSPSVSKVVTPAGRRREGTWQWVGLAAALVLITLGVYAIRHVYSPDAPGPGAVTSSNTNGNAPVTGSVEAFQEELRQAEQHYERAIAELEAIARNDDGSMDAETTAMLQKNLTTIDRAIADSREALNTNPSSEPARDSLFDALRQKVGVLQATVSLMNEMRKGNPGGAGKAAAGLGRKS
jgi:hypothetical protein